MTATTKTQTTRPLPTNPRMSAQPDEMDGEGGQLRRESSIASASDSILLIRECQFQRNATIKMQRSLNNKMRALVRRLIGWDPTLPDKERSKLNKAAEQICSAIEKGHAVGEPHNQTAHIAEPFCLIMLASRVHQDKFRKQLEKDMTKLAKSLPVWSWCEEVKGCGPLALAIIVGEAGDIGGYSTPAKLRKRMGIAVINGTAQGKRANVEEALEHGYNPSRRSSMWTIGDCLIKANGEYKEKYYDKRKIFEAEKPEVETKMHAHRRAQRYMEQKFLKHLWQAWRRCQTANANQLNFAPPSA